MTIHFGPEFDLLEIVPVGIERIFGRRQRFTRRRLGRRKGAAAPRRLVLA